MRDSGVLIAGAFVIAGPGIDDFWPESLPLDPARRQSSILGFPALYEGAGSVAKPLIEDVLHAHVSDLND